MELWPGSDFEEEFENYKTAINSENEICYLAKKREIYIAFIHVTIRKEYVEGATESPVAYVEGVYVKPAYQRQGIAKKLIDQAEDWAKQRGITQLSSDTNITNLQSIHFHEKIGFVEAERIVCYIKNI